MSSTLLRTLHTPWHHVPATSVVGSIMFSSLLEVRVSKLPKFTQTESKPALSICPAGAVKR